jgi:hypothetical protein
MDKFISKHLLADNCDAVENIGYTRRFTPEELSLRKEELAETSIKISEIEEEKKQADAAFKYRRKPLDETKSTLITQLKEKSEYIREDCFKYIYHDERMAGFYNADGELVYERPVNAQEMQKTIFSVARTGTDN